MRLGSVRGGEREEEDQLACFSEASCHSLDGKISFTSLAVLRTWEVVGLVRSEGRGSREGAAGIEEQTDTSAAGIRDT